MATIQYFMQSIQKYLVHILPMWYTENRRKVKRVSFFVIGVETLDKQFKNRDLDLQSLWKNIELLAKAQAAKLNFQPRASIDVVSNEHDIRMLNHFIDCIEKELKTIKENGDLILERKVDSKLKRILDNSSKIEKFITPSIENIHNTDNFTR